MDYLAYITKRRIYIKHGLLGIHCQKKNVYLAWFTWHTLPKEEYVLSMDYLAYIAKRRICIKHGLLGIHSQQLLHFWNEFKY